MISGFELGSSQLKASKPTIAAMTLGVNNKVLVLLKNKSIAFSIQTAG